MMLGDRIRQRCAEPGVSTAELARQATLSTGSRSALAGGQRARPSAQVLARLATALGTTIADRLGQELWPQAATVPPRLQLCTAAAEPPPTTRMVKRPLDAFERAVPAADREAVAGVAERTGVAAWARRRWARTFWAGRPMIGTRGCAWYRTTWAA
jgi:transcriptional regulator with XRE-family HTH domain